LAFAASLTSFVVMADYDVVLDRLGSDRTVTLSLASRVVAKAVANLVATAPPGQWRDVNATDPTMPIYSLSYAQRGPRHTTLPSTLAHLLSPEASLSHHHHETPPVLGSASLFLTGIPPSAAGKLTHTLRTHRVTSRLPIIRGVPIPIMAAVNRSPPRRIYENGTSLSLSSSMAESLTTRVARMDTLLRSSAYTHLLPDWIEHTDLAQTREDLVSWTASYAALPTHSLSPTPLFEHAARAF